VEDLVGIASVAVGLGCSHSLVVVGNLVEEGMVDRRNFAEGIVVLLVGNSLGSTF